MITPFDELTKSLARTVPRRDALKKFGTGLVGIALAHFGMANRAAGAPQDCDPSVGCCCRDCKTLVPKNHPNYESCKAICSLPLGCGPGKPRFS